MKVFLRMSVEVLSCNPGQIPTSIDEVKEAVQEAVGNAMYEAQQNGYEHFMEDEISLKFDYADVIDTDFENEWD